MAWSSASEFFAMGGYGLFVWGSFGMCALVIGAEMLLVGLRRKAVRRAAQDDQDALALEARP